MLIKAISSFSILKQIIKIRLSWVWGNEEFIFELTVEHTVENCSLIVKIRKPEHLSRERSLSKFSG